MEQPSLPVDFIIERRVLVALTLMLAGRAMTLAFIGSAGGAGPDDPPAAWLMPLVGDAIIGLTAIPVAYLAWKARGLAAWTTIVVWNALAIWDALSAFVIHTTDPWPSFFMIKLIGPAMFFAAALMHAGCLYLACREPVRRTFLRGEGPPAAT